MRDKLFNKANAVVISGLFIMWIVPWFAYRLNSTMAAYFMGLALALVWREWVQFEIDKRKQEQDRVNHVSLQEWYERKHGTK